MRSLRPCLPALFLILTVFACIQPVLAQVSVPDEETLATARKRGVKFLQSQQKRDGHWSFSDHDAGVTALCTIALIENGVELTDPSVQNGYEFVKKKAKELKNTYDIALTIVMLQRLGDRRDKPLIRTMAARLIAGQLETGGWHYTCPGPELDVEKVMKDAGPKPKDGFGDNSCTQFAVLGLWVASRAGIDIEKTMKRVNERFKAHQTDDGGWSYGLDPKLTKQVSGPSMTGAGLFCLAVARAWEIKEAIKDASKSKKEEPKKETLASARATLLDDPTFARGLKRTGEFSLGIGPGAGRYFLWSVERVGVLLAMEKIGDVPWFAVGANALLKDQRDDGSWPTAWVEADKDSLTDTCFALLFLRRANLGSDISRLLEVEYDEKFEILGRQPAARFLKLSDAIDATQPGETIRVNGNGPWRIGNQIIDKDVTILAAHGFAPVFKFEIGRDKKGTRFNPANDPEGRRMIHVAGGKVTFEGIKFQMEPSRDAKLVPWSTVTVEGGELRLLNCSLTETVQQGTAAVTWKSPGSLVIRNCQLMGGRTGVEVLPSGEQELVFDNSLAFSQSAFTLASTESTGADSKLTLRIRHAVCQVKEVLACGTVKGEIEVDAEKSAFQADWLSQNFLRDGKNPRDGRNWKGRVNLYDVKQWVGVDGRPADIKEARDWAKYWSNAEADVFKRKAPFVGTRRVGNYSHEASVQDWLLEFPTTAEPPLFRNRVGIITYVAGPGTAYDQYRETIGYTYWTRRRLELAETAPAQTGIAVSLAALQD